MSPKHLPGEELAAILSATDPEATFEAARTLGIQGTKAIPELLECLHELSGGSQEAPVWGVASALYWVLHRYLEAVGGRRAILEEATLNGAVDGLALALVRLGRGMESAAIKIGTILGDEIPRAAAEHLADDVSMPLRARLLDRCRRALEKALGNEPAPTIGALTGLSQLAVHVGPALVRPAMERALERAGDPKVEEVARWALAMLEE